MADGFTSELLFLSCIFVLKELLLFRPVFSHLLGLCLAELSSVIDGALHLGVAHLQGDSWIRGTHRQLVSLHSGEG